MDDACSEYQDQPEAASGQGEQPITEDGSPPSNEGTIHLPTEFLQGTTFKPGDEVVLKVVSAGDDGIEVEYAKAPEGGEGDGMGMSANDEIDQMHAKSMEGY